MIKYPMRGYTGYGDGSSTDVADYISDEMRLDWQNLRAELMAFWQPGKAISEAYPHDCLPWLANSDGPELPCAALHLD